MWWTGLLVKGYNNLILLKRPTQCYKKEKESKKRLGSDWLSWLVMEYRRLDRRRGRIRLALSMWQWKTKSIHLKRESIRLALNSNKSLTKRSNMVSLCLHVDWATSIWYWCRLTDMEYIDRRWLILYQDEFRAMAINWLASIEGQLRRLKC